MTWKASWQCSTCRCDLGKLLHHCDSGTRLVGTHYWVSLLLAFMVLITVFGGFLSDTGHVNTALATFINPVEAGWATLLAWASIVLSLIILAKKKRKVK